MISSAQISGRRLNVFPETHIVIAHKSQLTDFLDQAIENLQIKYKNKLPSLISNITGPSRTADIEKTLVNGYAWAKIVDCYHFRRTDLKLHYGKGLGLCI